MIRQLLGWVDVYLLSPSPCNPCYWMRGNLLLNNSISVLCCPLDEEGDGGKEVPLLICSCPSFLFLLALIRLERRQGWSTDWALCHAGTNFPTMVRLIQTNASFQLLLASQQSASYQFQTTSLLVKIQMPDKLQLFIPCSLLSTLQHCQVSIECGQMWSATKTSKLLRCRRNLLHAVSSPISKLTIGLILPLAKGKVI